MGSDDPANSHPVIVCVHENSHHKYTAWKTPRRSSSTTTNNNNNHHHHHHRETATQRRMIGLVSVALVFLIMVVDIAALISSGNPIQTSRSVHQQSFLVPSQAASRLQTQTQKQTQTPKQASSSSLLLSSSSSSSSTAPAFSLASSMGRNPLVPSQVGGNKSERAGIRLSSSINSANDTEQSNKKTKPKPKPKSKTTPPNEKPGTQRNNNNNNNNHNNSSNNHSSNNHSSNNTNGKRNTKPRNRVQTPTKAAKTQSQQSQQSQSQQQSQQSQSQQQSQQQSPQSQQQSQHRKRKKPRSGNLPDVLWRHIPMEHVRKHPSFVPLPEPHTIDNLECLEDVCRFRQESWQWDVLHEGRMTTSQAVAALGFLEPVAGDILGVPRGLRRGGIGAYHRLRKPVAMTTLEEMNEHLCVGNNSNTTNTNNNNNNNNNSNTTNTNTNNNNNSNSNNKSNSNNNNNNDNDNDNDDNYWTQPPSFPFAAKYMVPVTEEDLVTRRQLAKKIAQTKWSIRMVWGNVQEATALLTALNYFWKKDRGVVMKEIGMCGAGLEFNRTTQTTTTTTTPTPTTALESQPQSQLQLQTGLLLGATPDAVLCHPDGRIEAVEVKNHCPFIPNTAQRSKGNKANNKYNNSKYNNNKYNNKYNNNNHAFRLSQQGLSSSSSSSSPSSLSNKNRNKNENNKKSVMCQYLPQLMMEMLCLGENCKSAIMVRQTATNGSLILRIHRDDQWIEEMIYWLERFYSEFVQEGIPPPENFFCESHGKDKDNGKDSDSDSGSGSEADRDRYRAFLEYTKTVESTKVELLEHVPNRSVQRAMARHPVSNDLFLD